MKLKHMLFSMFLTIALIEITVLSIVLHTTQKNMNSEAVKNSEILLEYYSSQLESQMDFAQNDLRQLADNPEILYTSTYEDSSEQWYFEKLHIKKYLQNVLDLNRILDGAFLFRTDTDTNPYYAISSKYTNYEQELQLKKLITSGDFSQLSGHWFFHEVADEEYFLYFEKGLYGWYGIWIQAHSILLNFEQLSPQSQSGLYICNLNGEVLESQSSIPLSDSFVQAENGTVLKINKKNYIKAASRSTQEDFILAALLPEAEVTKELSSIRPLLAAVIVINLLLLILCIFCTKRYVYNPLDHLTRHMELVKKGDLKTQITLGDQPEEFNAVYNTFNEMQNSILTLKLDNYERKLQEEQTKRQFLQSQIKSHFFLNCLNIIYMLAQGKQYKLIQELNLCMANYMRYLTRPAEQPVLLSQELDHVRNYMSIQTLRYHEHIHFSCDVSEETLNQAQIYPLMIQTFVENSMKYAMDPEEDDNQISVSIAYSTPVKDMISICIEDSGPGFPAELLQTLNQDSSLPLNGLSGIGIANVKCRLKLFYGENASISFGNCKPHGAKTTLLIPLIK